MGVSLNADGQLLASGGLGGTVRLWDARSSASVCTLRSDHRCERLDITGLTDITEAQRQAMLALGAVVSEVSTSPEQVRVVVTVTLTPFLGYDNRLAVVRGC